MTEELKQPFLTKMRSEQFTIERLDVTKGCHGLLLRRSWLLAMRYRLLNGILEVRTQFIPGLFTFWEWQSRHCFAEKAFRFRCQARH